MIRHWTRCETASIVAAVMVLASPVGARADDVGCQRAIARASAAYVQGRAKALGKCVDGKTKGRLRADDPCSGDPKTMKKLDALRVKLFAEINRSCGGANRDCGDGDDLPIGSTGWGGVATCPDFEGSGCTNPIVSCTDISSCLRCVGDTAVDQAVETYAGEFDTDEFGTSSTVNRCQRAINKATSKFVEARAKTLQRCWDSRLRGRHANPCPDPGDGKAQRALDKAESRKVIAICKACGGPDRLCNGVGDLTPSEIGFATTCPAVTPVGGSSCGGPIADLSDVVACIDCVSAFKTDCPDAAAVPQLVSPYPATCNVSPSTTSSSTTTTTIPSTTTTSAPPPTTTSTTSSTSTTGSSTTSTTSSTTPTTEPPSTSTTTSSTTTSTIGVAPTLLDFLTTTGGGVCGQTYDNVDGTGTPIGTVTCGGLKLGGGASIVGENVTPDGFTNRFALTCFGNGCLVLPQASSTDDYECTQVGCNFGTPLPLEAGAISSCILNTFKENPFGTIDLSTGAASLNIFLNSLTKTTSDQLRPCPVCVDGGGDALAGSPSTPLMGTCSGGLTPGATCITRNSQGLTHDCLPAGLNNGIVEVNLAPLTTSSSVKVAADRIFCPELGQTGVGCFKEPGQAGKQCRRIQVTGTPAGPLVPNAPTPIKMASTFCVDKTDSALVNFSADLPGPGATVLVGEMTTRP